MISDKKYKALSFIGLAISMAALTFSIVAYGFQTGSSQRALTATELFDMSKSSVVELKAEGAAHGTAYGSAVCIDDRQLVTNAHVVTYSDGGDVKLYESVSVRLYNSDEYLPTTIVDYDVSKDLCLLELAYRCDGMKPVRLSGDASARPGERVFAVGNAMNHGIGITEGIVSIPLINVSIGENEMAAMQCNITITSGSSGGALLNVSGELIGITTFRLKDQNGYIVHGMGFALPATTVKGFLEQRP